jgi:hypothetical protein
VKKKVTRRKPKKRRQRAIEWRVGDCSRYSVAVRKQEEKEGEGKEKEKEGRRG